MTEIWIIEDNIDYSASVREAINQSECCLCSHEFETVADALKKLSKENYPDVILTDINLPGLDGISGIEKIKSKIPEIEIIVLTVFNDDQKIFDAICNGANGYLLKNSSPAEILDAVNTVINGGSFINASLARRVFNMFAETKQTQNTYGLTKREKEILKYLVDGKTVKEIAKVTFTSPQTVQTHVKNIYFKVQVNSRGGLVSKALREGLVK